MLDILTRKLKPIGTAIKAWRGRTITAAVIGVAAMVAIAVMVFIFSTPLPEPPRQAEIATLPPLSAKDIHPALD